MKSIIILFITLFVFKVYSFNYHQKCVTRGTCPCNGIEPTYDCGKKCGFKNFDSTWKVWRTDVAYNSCFDKCCETNGKDYCYTIAC